MTGFLSSRYCTSPPPIMEEEIDSETPLSTGKCTDWGATHCISTSGPRFSRNLATQMWSLIPKCQTSSCLNWCSSLWFMSLTVFTSILVWTKNSLNCLCSLDQLVSSSHYLHIELSALNPLRHEPLWQENIWRWVWYSRPFWEGDSCHGWLAWTLSL